MVGWLLNVVYAMVTPIWVVWRCCIGRRTIPGWKQKFFGAGARPPGKSGPRIWLHGVSVGEVQLLGTLIDRLQKAIPGCSIVVTTTTSTGFDVACKRYAEHHVEYCPFDFTWAIRRFLKRVQPDCLVLGELELWPNLIRTTHGAGIPVVVANGRISESSFRGYRRVAWLMRRLLRSVDLVLAQNATYKKRFVALGTPEERVSVTGSVKFDGVETNRKNEETCRMAALIGLPPHATVVLAGSTSEPEESIIGRCWKGLENESREARLILVPRHPERCDGIIDELQALGIRCHRRSELTAAGSADDVTRDAALIVDTVGELSAWWGLADIAYVGGSMGKRGGQNMIEPAAYGAAVSFGPNTKNFRDVVALLRDGDAAIQVQDEAELQRFLKKGLLQPEWRSELGGRARALVRSQVGAADQTVERICRLLAHRNERRKAA